MAEGAWCGCIHIVWMALMSGCCRLSIFFHFYSMHSLCYYPCDTNKPTQSRASISMFAFFFYSVKQGFVRFTLHLDSNVHVHIQFGKLIDLHVLSSVKLYKHPFLVWMLFSLFMHDKFNRELRSKSTILQLRYSSFCVFFSSQKSLRLWCSRMFYQTVILIFSRYFWMQTQVGVVKNKFASWCLNDRTCCAIFQSKGNELRSNDAELSKNIFFCYDP